MMMNASGSFGLLGLLMMTVTAVALILGGVWLYHRFEAGPEQRPALDSPRETSSPALDSPRETSTPAGDPALTRLRERYAAGDINDEEYERRLSALKFWS